jgi:YVTN family beta-propeller protein
MRTLTLIAIFSLAFAGPVFACSPRVVFKNDYLLVGNKAENSVSYINLETGRETGRVPVSGSAPHEIAITPDGHFAAVVNYGGATIDVFEIGRKSIIATIELGENKNPHGLVALKSGGFVATTEGGKSVVQLTPNIKKPTARRAINCQNLWTYSWTVDAIPTEQDGTHMIAVSPDESIAYTANMQSGTVSRINLETERVISAPAGKEVEGIAVTKDGAEVWASVRGEDKVVIFDATSLERLAEIPVGSFPLRIIVSPDGTKMVTSNLKDGSVSVIDVKSRKVERTIRVSGSDQTRQVTLLFNEDGTRLYVAETGANKIAEIDFESGRLIGRLSGGEQGDGLAIVPAFGGKKGP